MAALDYEILVPSRRRVAAAANTLSLVPTAKVYVDEAEADDYARAVGAERVRTHKPLTGMAAIRTAMIRQCTTSAMIMLDDDLRGIVSLLWRRPKRITDPGMILQILENGMNLANDLGLHFFCWSRNPHPAQFKACDPFGLAAPMSQAIVVIGKDIVPDRRLLMYEDVDMSLSALLTDRIVINDRRYYFDFGGCWQGAGGNQGIRTETSDSADRALLGRKWRSHLVFGYGHKGGIGAKKHIHGMSIRVQRKSPIAASR